ncbi:MAG: hypothetical protein EBQ75_00200 [Actinobacteria bacterium]|nr:hypothetical protein [Actinomycetota bacterium]
MLEERGTVRRGYFVEGLGAAQFALPGAVDRLRAERETVDVELHPDRVPEPIVLSATDPANRMARRWSGLLRPVVRRAAPARSS